MWLRRPNRPPDSHQQAQNQKWPSAQSPSTSSNALATPSAVLICPSEAPRCEHDVLLFGSIVARPLKSRMHHSARGSTDQTGSPPHAPEESRREMCTRQRFEARRCLCGGAYHDILGWLAKAALMALFATMERVLGPRRSLTSRCSARTSLLTLSLSFVDNYCSCDVSLYILPSLSRSIPENELHFTPEKGKHTGMESPSYSINPPILIYALSCNKVSIPCNNPDNDSRLLYRKVETQRRNPVARAHTLPQ